MKSVNVVLACLFAVALASKSAPSVTRVSAANAIVVEGTQLKDSVTGARFFVHGATYDYEVDDAAIGMWKPALDLLIATVPNLNALRFYEVTPNKSYAKFIEYTNSKGIYLMVPLTPAGESTDFGHCAMAADASPAFPQAEGEQTCYPSCLLNFGQRVMNIFSKSPNTLTYIVANEVIDHESRWAAAPCVKSYTRDLKAYQRSCSAALRYVPLIYTDADNGTSDLKSEQNNRLKSDYLTCDSEDQRIDLYGYNMFRWCSSTCTYETCGWNQVHDAMSGAGIPLLLTEHGCGTYYKNSALAQREWKEVPVLYSSKMTDTFSGGNGYSYGIRGDKGQETFSFFGDGVMAHDGFPGAKKNCDAQGNCNVDMYSTQLNAALAAGVPTAASRSNRFTTDPVCPTRPGIDLTIADSRQGAPGYDLVRCPAGGIKPPTSSTGPVKPPSSSSGGVKPPVSSSTGSNGGNQTPVEPPTDGGDSTPVDPPTDGGDSTPVDPADGGKSTPVDESTTAGDQTGTPLPSANNGATTTSGAAMVAASSLAVLASAFAVFAL